ncbi:MAG: DUF5682 family protein [Acidobacteriota bacterium]
MADEVAAPRRELARWREDAAACGAELVPIRHHSPACARHVAARIRTLRPSVVLVEGPDDMTPLIPLLLHEEMRPPVAVYASAPLPRTAARWSPDAAPPRAVSFYPLCDYSPELVALREGAAVGARLAFIDLTWREQVAARVPAEEGQDRHVVSLLADAHLARSELLAALAERTGCRDADELWDHLFEVRQPRLDAATFADEVLAFCLLARLDAAPEALEADGTLARERAMASAIRAAVAARAAADGPVLVVTGGFHTVHLPRLLVGDDELPPRPTPRAASSPEAGAPCLIRYSFDRLDALHGYASGMPSPRYHQTVWSLGAAGDEDGDEAVADPFTEAAARLLVEIGRASRTRDLADAVSAADEIAALDACRRLPALRGHAGPTRADLLDAVRSVYLRGGGDSSPLGLLVYEVLGGRELGAVPPAAGRPPIVADFHRRAEALRLSLDSIEPRDFALDLYRTRRHRRVSRFLHALSFLEVPFARRLGGPDFVAGSDLERLQEHWQIAWSPQVEGALIDAAVHGDTVDEACLDRLRAAALALEAEGRGRDAAAPVRLLVTACRMGLQRDADRLLELIDRGLAEDPSFAAVVGALGELLLLWISREPLEAHRLEALPALVVVAYRRACFLLDELASVETAGDREGTVGDDEASALLEALVALRQVLDAVDPGQSSDPQSLDTGNALDPDLFFDAVERVATARRAAPELVGAAVGLLHSAGRLGEAQLLRRVEGHLAGAVVGGSAAARGVGMLHGLLTTCREVLWRIPGLVERLDAMLRSWSDDELLAALPRLRLCLGRLTPREIDRVAAVVARQYGLGNAEAFGDLVLRQVPEAEVLLNLRLGGRLRAALAHDGLEAS